MATIKLLIWRIIFAGCMSRMAFTLSGSGVMPFWLILCPRAFISAPAKSHYNIFALLYFIFSKSVKHSDWYFWCDHERLFWWKLEYRRCKPWPNYSDHEHLVHEDHNSCYHTALVKPNGSLLNMYFPKSEEIQILIFEFSLNGMHL